MTQTAEPARQRPLLLWRWAMRHWRGELSLASSFWLSGLLAWSISFLLSVGEQVLPPNQRWAAVRGLLLTCLITGLEVWRLLGIWRSAGRAIQLRRSQRRRAIWAYLARFVVAGSALVVTAVAVLFVVPISWTNLQLAAGVDAEFSHSVALRNQGREIDVSGLIGLGTTDDVVRLLRTSPDARTVDLDSRGGRLIEARALREVIRQRGLATYVATSCFSACTIVFLGGNPRILRQGAKLGFHHYFATGLLQASLPIHGLRDRDDFAFADVPSAFIARVFATPSSTLWIPTDAELLAAHVATQLTDGSGFSAAAGGWMTTKAGATAALLGSSSYAALSRRAPELFANAVSAAMAAANDDGTLAQAVGAAQPYLVAGFARSLRVASDSLQFAQLHLLADEARGLEAQHPVACAALFGHKTAAVSGDPLRLLPPALQQRDREMTRTVIDEAGAQPDTAIASAAQAAALLQQVRGALAVQPRHDAWDAGSYCHQMIAMVEGLSAQPLDRLGPVMRRIDAGATP